MEKSFKLHFQVEFPDNGRASEDEGKRKGEEPDEKYAPESTHGWRCLSQPIKSQLFLCPPPTPTPESIKSHSTVFLFSSLMFYSMCQSGASVYFKSSGVAGTSTQ